MAVREDHIDMAEFLLGEGADVNIVDKDLRSDQNNTIHFSSLPITVNFSVFFFFPPNFFFLNCRSPLMITAGNGLIGMLRLLLQFNAEVSLKDAKGWSADDHAVINGYHP